MKKAIIFLLTALMIFSLCGCGKKSENQNAAVSKKSHADLKPGGSVEAYMLKPDTLNPLITGIDINRCALKPIYNSLFRIDGSLKAVPELAYGYEFSDNSRTLKITLCSGVLWHDGSPFDSSDVVYTVKNILSYEEIYCHNVISDLIAGISAPDANTVIFKFFRPSSGAASLLTFPILKYERGNMVAHASDYMPIGTGGFKVKDYDGKSVLLLEKNADSKVTVPYVDEIILNILPDIEAAYTAFSAGITDFVKINHETAGKISVNANSDYAPAYTNKYTFLGLNTENRLLEKPEIRKLIASAIMQTKSVESLFGKYISVCDVPVNPNSFCYLPEENPKTFEENAEAYGIEHSDSGSLYIKDGDETLYLSFTILVNEENSSRLLAADSVSKSLESVGISARIITVDFETYMNALDERDFDMFIGGTVLSGDLNLSPLLGSEGKLNYGGYSSEKTDSLLQSAARESDVKSDLPSKLQNDFRSSYPHIPLYFENETIVYNSRKLGNVNPVFSENCFDFLNECCINR